jgi:hypothetical protein
MPKLSPSYDTPLRSKTIPPITKTGGTPGIIRRQKKRSWIPNLETVRWARFMVAQNPCENRLTVSTGGAEITPLKEKNDRVTFDVA